MDRKSKEFLELKAKWYNKLKKSGFVDAEQDENYLVAWHDFKFALNHSPTEVAAKMYYYTRAEHFLHTNKFGNPLEKHIWKLHSEGKTFRQISRALTERGTPKSTMTVHYHVTKLAKKMRMTKDE